MDAKVLAETTLDPQEPHAAAGADRLEPGRGQDVRGAARQGPVAALHVHHGVGGAGGGGRAGRVTCKFSG